MTMKSSIRFGTSRNRTMDLQTNNVLVVMHSMTYACYSAIQFCPDLGQFESANIGVLL